MKIERGMPLRQPPTPEQMDEKLKDVSKLYEKQFLREMMKQMRATVTEGGFMPANNAEKIFREQLDQEYVEKWGDQGGIGLSKLIYDQLMERMGPSLGLRTPLQKPQGPLQINDKSQERNAFKLQPAASQSTRPQRTLIEYDLQKSALQDPAVTAPWSGSLLGVKSLGANENLLEIEHDNGLKSQMVFRGVLEKNFQPAHVKAGAEIQAGQRLGLLSPEAKSLFWTVDVVDSL